MKSMVSTLLLTATVALFTQQAGAIPAHGEVVDGHLHLLARRTEEYGTHRSRHHARANSKRACQASSSSSSDTESLAKAKANAQVKVAVAGGSSSSSSKSAAKAASTSSSSASSASTSSSNGATSSSSSLGTVTAFAGTNTNAILSWFRTDSSSDSTNGQSWCQTPYQDSWICFAPSVGTMLNEFGGDYTKAATAFCGREAIVTNPATGKSITAFICDGFDDTWVRTPASLDLTVGAFTEIYGSFDNNKDTVIQGATWKLTGNVVQEGTFQTGKK